MVPARTLVRRGVLLQEIIEACREPTERYSLVHHPINRGGDPILGKDISLVGAMELTLSNHMQGLTPLYRPLCRGEQATFKARVDAVFDRAMILLR